MKTATAILLVLWTAGCGAPVEREPVSAEQIARETLIVDGHVDVPYRLRFRNADVSVRTEDGHFDFHRAVEGGLNAPFMSIYVPSEYEEGGARELADELIDAVIRLTTRYPEQFALASSPDQLEEHQARGLVSLPMGMENGSPIEGDLANLRHFHDRGVRYISLTHSKCNHIGDSSYDPERLWNGLSPFGRELVREMNRIGMMVDVSHVSDETFYDIMEISSAPVIASHSSCRRFTPGFERNMDDAMIRRLAEGGGLIMINFGSAFLDGAAQEQSTAFWNAWKQYSEENGGMDHGGMRAFSREYWKDKDKITGDVGTLADHIDHAVELAGIDHVGIGSDFDGVGTLPVGMEDVSKYPNLVQELLDRGYGRESIEKILSGNILRVWRQVEQVAADLQTGEQS